MPLPFVEVSHLPSSSSFYSAVCQPLGLRYLTADRSSSDGAPALVFGLPQPSLTPLFQVRQVAPSPDRPLKRSRFVLAAESQEAVREVYECALRAHARNSDDDTGKENSASVSEDRARIKDLDGNTMEVVYIPPQSYPARYGGSTVRRTQSTPKEVNRIMDWNYDVASSSGPSIAPGPGAPPMLRRSATDHLPSPRENSQGITAASVAGIIGAAVVGAAAGAAITYAVSRGSERAHENSPFMPAPLPRRSTFPDPYPYAHVDRKERFVDVDQHSMHKGRFPDEQQQQRFAERASGPPPPAYAYKHVLPPPSASRARDDLDSRSHHSSRYSRPSVKRSTSEAPVTRAPLLLAETEHRSSAGSRYSVAPAPPPGSMRRSVTYDVADRRSFVSAKSRHTASTVRGGGGGPPAPSVTLPIRSSRPPSTASTIKAYNSGGGGGGRTSVKSYASSRSPPRERERELQREREFMEPMGPGMGMGMGMGMGARSHISARHVPLPRSAVGSFASARDVPLPASVAGWDDDAGSVAPSDSISCVGSRRSARSYR